VSCPENEGSLALLAGGDLPEALAGPLRAHADRCPDCRQALAALSETTDWLRGQRMAARMAALDRPMLDELQRRITREVTGRRQAPWLLAWWGRLFEAHRQPLGVDGGGLAGQPVLAVVGAALLVLGVVGALAGGRQAWTPPVPVPEAVHSASAAGAPPDPGLRIEMQTGDPNVRIIWFASETGRR
jgi:hypothetical protein